MSALYPAARGNDDERLRRADPTPAIAPAARAERLLSALLGDATR